MGTIRIEVRGSFLESAACAIDREFSAMDNGHADAVAQAIEFLSGTLLPKATELDHRLHNDGDGPRLGWERQRT